MEKIEISTLGHKITQWRNGMPYTAEVSERIALEQISEKLNEIVEWINNQKE